MEDGCCALVVVECHLRSFGLPSDSSDPLAHLLWRELDLLHAAAIALLRDAASMLDCADEQVEEMLHATG